MHLEHRTDALRQELRDDFSRALASLTELSSRYANDRSLVYRSVLLRREVSHQEEPPTAAQRDAAAKLLDDLIADQRLEAGQTPRHQLAEAARARALAMPVSRGAAFECEGLSKTYRRTQFALADVSVAVNAGQILGVVGRNGNGKTTLFRLVVGELKPDGGRLGFPLLQPDGGRVRWGTVGEQIAYVPQDLSRWYGSLASNLHFAASVHGIKGADNEREVDYIVDRLGLGDELHKRWHELSGGFKLRFALARALVWKPKLLILDEPLANLDFLTQQVVLNDIRHLTDSMRYPLAVMISSQHLHEIEAVADKLLLLQQGRVRYSGDVEGIGSGRRFNRFEIDGDIDLADLHRTFRGPEFHSVHYNGVAYVLATATTVAASDVMRRLLDSGLTVTYLRDISRSAKALLLDESDGI